MTKRVSFEPSAALILDGHSSPKLRRASTHTISDEQIGTFFATLTETCNVVRATKAAGFSTNWPIAGASAMRRFGAAGRKRCAKAMRG